jgi:hypothetical protein
MSVGQHGNELFELQEFVILMLTLGKILAKAYFSAVLRYNSIMRVLLTVTVIILT